MKRLIVNADDLGYSKEVNFQIEECVRRGVITSSTLMANAPAFEDGVRIAKHYNQISTGVHLNLVEFKPLTNINIFKKYGIVGDDDNFIDGAVFVKPINDELKQAVFEEWDAQIAKIKTVGIIPSHADSHQHTHTITALQDVLCKVLEKHNISKVRRKIIPSIRIMLFRKKQAKVVLNKSSIVQVPKRNIIYRRFHLFMVKYQSYVWNRSMNEHYNMTNAFYSFRDFYYNRSLLCLGDNKSVIELMCHPGQKAFQHETDILIKDLSWLPNNYIMINYNQL